MKRFAMLVLFASGATLVSGCMGGGGADRTASRGLFGGRGGATVAQGRNLDELSPEASMRRDLQLLEEEERTQLRRLDDLRRKGNGDPESLRSGEERLREIRGRIDRYNAMLRQEQMAARSGQSREYPGSAPVVPARVMDPRGGIMPASYSPDSYADARYAAASPMREYSSLPADYRRDAGQNMPETRQAAYAPQPGGMSRGGLDVREGERLMYAPPQMNGGYTDPDFAGMVPGIPASGPQPERRTITAPATVMPAESARQPGETRFGGAAVGRPSKGNASPAKRRGETDEWTGPETLFVDRSAPVRTDYPGLAASDEEKVDWPRSMPTQPTAARAPQPARAAVEKAPRAAPSPESVPAANGADYEIFVPDLYLSGR